MSVDLKELEAPPAFGYPMRKKQFTFDPEVTHLNHGSFGALPVTVDDTRKERLSEMERNPDLFICHSVDFYWRDAIKRVAPILGCKPGNITFVENVTAAISNILRSIPFATGDEILCNNHTYPAMQTAIHHIVKANSGVKNLVMDHCLPISRSDEIVNQYENVLNDNPRIKVALIDHISTFGLMFPVKQLVNLCKKRGVLTLVDGSHCPGHVYLNIEEIAPDFYVGSLHKWMFVPRGCAVQWVAPQFHDLVKPAVMSFGLEKSYPEPFLKPGTRDYTPYTTVPAACAFVEWIGGIESQHEYAEEIWATALPILTEAWGTSLADVPDDMLPPFLRLVQLPPLKNYQPVYENTQPLINCLFDKSKICCMVVYHQDTLYVRISVNIYVTKDDFLTLRDAVVDLMV